MTSRADHYREAERLLTEADQYVSENWPGLTGETKADILAAALVQRGPRLDVGRGRSPSPRSQAVTVRRLALIAAGLAAVALALVAAGMEATRSLS